MYLDEKRNIIIPPIKAVSVGDTALFHCLSIYNVTWNYQGGPLPHNAFTGLSVTGDKYLHYLRIDDIVPQNAGVYSCLEYQDNLLIEDDAILILKGLEIKHCFHSLFNLVSNF